MPDIHDLLHDASPAPTGYDEDDVRRRVGRRRRVRRAGVAVLTVVAVLGAYGVVVALDRTDERRVVTGRPTSSSTTTTAVAPTAGPTALAVVGDQVWIGGDEFVSLGDGSHRIEVPGPVEGLVAGDPVGLLWARGDSFVAAIDTGLADSHPAGVAPPASLLGTWEGAAADLVPLPSGHVALTSSDADEVVVVRTAAEGLEELERIPLRAKGTNIVRTTSGEVWVNEGDTTIALVDWGAGGVTTRVDWAGPLLAAALDGTIWTTDGSRVVSLDPAVLQTGALSAAEGERYDVDATMAVETSFGLYTGGPAGIVRFSPKTPDGEVVTTDAPAAMDVSGGQVAYVAGGEVHTATARGDTGTP